MQHASLNLCFSWLLNARHNKCSDRNYVNDTLHEQMNVYLYVIMFVIFFMNVYLYIIICWPLYYMYQLFQCLPALSFHTLFSNIRLVIWSTVSIQFYHNFFHGCLFCVYHLSCSMKHLFCSLVTLFKPYKQTSYSSFFFYSFAS